MSTEPGHRLASGVPAIGDPGRAAVELPAGPPPALGDCADHELSECSLPGLQVRAASVRGLLHRYRAQPRQDRFSLRYDEPSATLLVAVCDGVGSLPLSHEAAGFVARRMPDAYLDRGDWPEAIAEVNRELADHADQAARHAPADAPEAFGMATTFVGAALRLDGRPTVSLAWTDDSTAWLLRDGEWTKLTAEASRADAEVHTGGVRALPHREPRFRTALVPVDGGAVFVMSDGVGGPLETAAEVRDTLARWWASPPDVYTFAGQVGFARKSHLDDRTVVGIWFDPVDPTDPAGPVGAERG